MTRSLAVGAGIAAQFGKEGEHFLACGIRDRGQAAGACVKAFGGGAFGIDDLVLIEHEVQIGDGIAGLGAHGVPVLEMRRAYQHFVAAEKKFGAVAFKEDAVLR